MTTAVQEPTTVMPLEFEIALAARKYLKRQVDNMMNAMDDGDLSEEYMPGRFNVVIVDNGEEGIHAKLDDESFEKACTAFYDNLQEELELNGAQSALEWAARIMVRAVMDFAAEGALVKHLEARLEDAGDMETEQRKALKKMADMVLAFPMPVEETT